jgi:hypothetical protein
MYSAPSFVAKALAVVVLPTAGVPVMRITRFITETYWQGIVKLFVHN